MAQSRTDSAQKSGAYSCPNVMPHSTFNSGLRCCELPPPQKMFVSLSQTHFRVATVPYKYFHRICEGQTPGNSFSVALSAGYSSVLRQEARLIDADWRCIVQIDLLTYSLTHFDQSNITNAVPHVQTRLLTVINSIDNEAGLFEILCQIVTAISFQ